MSIPSYPFHSLPLKLPNEGMSFPFPPLKLSNKRMKEYSKMIIFIPSKQGPKNFLKKKKSYIKQNCYVYNIFHNKPYMAGYYLLSRVGKKSNLSYKLN